MMVLCEPYEPRVEGEGQTLSLTGAEVHSRIVHNPELLV